MTAIPVTYDTVISTGDVMRWETRNSASSRKVRYTGCQIRQKYVRTTDWIRPPVFSSYRRNSVRRKRRERAPTVTLKLAANNALYLGKAVTINSITKRTLLSSDR